MKKQIISLFLLFGALMTSFYSNAQCMVEHIELSKRLTQSPTVIEGQVIQQLCFWDADQKAIHTANLIKVSKVYKGAKESYAVLVTFGGIVGDEMHRADPALTLKKGDHGIFMMRSNTTPLPSGLPTAGKTYYEPRFSVQSFIQYDDLTAEAFDHDQYFASIRNNLYPYLNEQVGQPVVIGSNQYDDAGNRIVPLATPIINSINVDTVSSGTGTILTINGKNFGFARGSGYVGFRDANFGDGRFYRTEASTSYESWSDSKIEVLVPPRAGTGKIRVVNPSGEAGTSSFDLFVKFAHINVFYGASGVDTAYNQVKHVEDDNSGGYTWQFNSNFKKHTNAVNAFIRSLENWRCGTLMNWKMGADVTLDDRARDDVNIVRFTDFTDSRLGVCYSYHRGCFDGNGFDWYLNELDIEFDSTGRNWYYGTGSPANNQMDFESVATHELGHGHQLAHVIDPSKVMHYSIGAGQRKVSLHPFDIEGGEYVRDRSKATRVCGPDPLEPIALGDCSITKPKANASASNTIICPGEEITITDETEGLVNNYTWDFGEDASPGTASTVGPHTVSYTTSGDKSVRLIVINDFGSDTAFLNLTVLEAAPEAPDTFWNSDQACLGAREYQINAVTGATAYRWNLTGGGTIFGADDEVEVTVNWTAKGGPHTLSVVAIGACGESEESKTDFTVVDEVDAEYSFLTDGVEVTFANLSVSSNDQVWYFGDGDSSTEADPTHTYTDQGDYTVLLRARNGCSEDTISKTVTVEWTASILYKEWSDVTVYPNPAEHLVTIEASSSEKTDLVVTDIEGRVIHQALGIAQQHQLDVSDWSTGMYYLVVSRGTAQITIPLYVK
jgi:PKD repeat protein